jgi:hypothetical protein
LIDVNRQAHKDDKKLTINMKDITCEVQYQTNQLENKEECYSGNRSVLNIHPIPSILGNQESENNNDMDISMTRNIIYEMYTTNKRCAEPTE